MGTRTPTYAYLRLLTTYSYLRLLPKDAPPTRVYVVAVNLQHTIKLVFYPNNGHTPTIISKHTLVDFVGKHYTESNITRIYGFTRPPDSVLSGSEGWIMPRRRPRAKWLSQVEYHLKDGRGGPGVCLGDGKTDADGVPSQRGRGDALLRRMLAHHSHPHHHITMPSCPRCRNPHFCVQ